MIESCEALAHDSSDWEARRPGSLPRRMDERTPIVDGTPLIRHLHNARGVQPDFWRNDRPRHGRGTRFAPPRGGIPDTMIREAEAIVRKQRFLLCRYGLIFVT